MSPAQSRLSAKTLGPGQYSVGMEKGEFSEGLQDSLDFGIAIVTFSRVGSFLSCELPEGRRSFIVFDDIPWCDNISEPIAFSYFSTFFSFTTDHKDSLVSLNHLPHGCVAYDNFRIISFID